MNLSEILMHLGEERTHYYNAVAPPVIQSSNFVFDTLEEFRDALSSELDNHIYTRGNNPTVAILRKKLAALEGTEDALVFASGSGAIAAAVVGNVQIGDHIVCVQKPYSWTIALLTKFLHRFGVTHTFVDGTDLAAIEAAIQPNTKILYLESPNSLTFEIQDLKACAAIAQRHNLVSIIDNSYASPIFQKPAEHGIDIILHSGTKYLNGHSDVVVGVMCANKKMIEKVFNSELMTLGAIISPHDANLVLRGLRTLELRMQRSHNSALQIVHFLEKHPKVKEVIYPFSKTHPQYALAQKQMQGAGGLFSFHLDVETLAQAETFFHALNHFLLAVSWGGHESLVMPTAGFYNIKGRADSPIPFTLVRLYIGLEDPKWLIDDLNQALNKVDLFGNKD